MSIDNCKFQFVDIGKFEFGEARRFRMKKYIVLILGILLLIISFIWMILSETSTGPFLVLSAISRATIAEGIHQVRKNGY